MATRRCCRVAISRVWRDSLLGFYARLVKSWRIEGEEDRHFAWI